MNALIDLRQIISLIQHLGLGIVIGISIIIFMKATTYIGFPNNIASIIATFGILSVPICFLIWMIKEIKHIIKYIKEIENGNKRYSKQNI